MPLTRSDHKRIAQSIVAELRQVLSAHGGDRLMAKHKARMTSKQEEPSVEEGDDQEALEAIAAGSEAEDELEQEIPPERKKRPFAKRG